MKKKHKKKKGSINIGLAQESYWDMAGQEARKLVGNQTQIKGTIHEIVVRDKKNLSLQSILSGEMTSLAKSRHSTAVDLVTLKSGKVISRSQLKDVISRKGIDNVVKQAKSGKYRSVKLIGTNETKALYDARSSSGGKIMHSSGVSTNSTTRAAHNTGAKIRGNDVIAGNMKDIAGQSGNSAILSAILTGGLEAVSCISDMRKGHINGAEFAGRVIKTTSVSAISGGAKTGAALAMKEGGKAVAKKIGGETAKRIAGSNAATVVAFGIVEQALDTAKLFSGKIDGKEYGSRTVQNVSGTGGAIGGAAFGASIGSVVPGIGTAIGGLVGGIVGGIGGGSIGKWISSWF